MLGGARESDDEQTRKRRTAQEPGQHLARVLHAQTRHPGQIERLGEPSAHPRMDHERIVEASVAGGSHTLHLQI